MSQSLKAVVKGACKDSRRTGPGAPGPHGRTRCVLESRDLGVLLSRHYYRGELLSSLPDACKITG